MYLSQSNKLLKHDNIYLHIDFQRSGVKIVASSLFWKIDLIYLIFYRFFHISAINSEKIYFFLCSVPPKSMILLRFLYFTKILGQKLTILDPFFSQKSFLAGGGVEVARIKKFLLQKRLIIVLRTHPEVPSEIRDIKWLTP